MFEASRGANTRDGVAFTENVGGVKLSSRGWGIEFVIASAGSTMRDVFDIVLAVAVFVFAAIAATADVEIGSKSSLSLGVDDFVARTFFFYAGDTFVLARFLF